MKNTAKTFGFIFFLVAFIACFVLFFVRLLTIEPYVDPTIKSQDIVATQTFKVKSIVKSVLSQKYTTTLTGTLKNQTDSKISKLNIYIVVVSGYIGNEGTLKIEDITIEPNSEYKIKETFEDTPHNFEKVSKIVGLVGEVMTDTKLNNDNAFEILDYDEDLRFDLMCYVYLIGLIVSLIFAIVFGIVNSKANKVEQKPLKVEAQDYTNIGEAELLENDVKVLKLKLEREKIQNEIDNLKGDDIVYCEYCGTKNKKTADVCISCGGQIKRKK